MASKSNEFNSVNEFIGIDAANENRLGWCVVLAGNGKAWIYADSLGWPCLLMKYVDSDRYPLDKCLNNIVPRTIW